MDDDEQTFGTVYKEYGFPYNGSDTDKANWYFDVVKKGDVPPHMANWLNGNGFEHATAHHFRAMQISIDSIDKNGNVQQQFRVDALTRRQVISLKYTQLAEINKPYAKKIIDEFIEKYEPGKQSLLVTASRGNGRKLDPGEIGVPLKGEMVLGVPTQNQPIPEWIIDYAADAGAGIRIREYSMNLGTEEPR